MQRRTTRICSVFAALVGLAGTTGCIRELTVIRAAGVAMDDAEAMEIFARMSEILSQPDSPEDFPCATAFQPELDQVGARTAEERAQIEREVARRGGSVAGPAQPLRFMLDGPVQEFAGPRDIMTGQDFFAVLAQPAFVRVVASIHRCGNGMVMTGILACAPLNGRNGLVTEDIGGATPNPGASSLVWSHEYGHSVGLPDLQNQPTRVMNGFLDRRARNISRQDCLAYTRAIDGNGPSPRPAAAATAPGAAGATSSALESTGRRSPDVPVAEFVRQQHHHGLGYDVRNDFGPGDVPALLDLLADPAEADHRDNIAAILGLIGDEAVGDVLVAHVESMRREPLPESRSDELTSALLGLGALANHNQSDALVDRLHAWSDPASWNPESAALGRHVEITALMAMAMSGLEPARGLLAARAATNRDPALQANLDEIRDMAGTVATRGLAAYMNGETE